MRRPRGGPTQPAPGDRSADRRAAHEVPQPLLYQRDFLAGITAQAARLSEAAALHPHLPLHWEPLIETVEGLAANPARAGDWALTLAIVPVRRHEHRGPGRWPPPVDPRADEPR